MGVGGCGYGDGGGGATCICAWCQAWCNTSTTCTPPRVQGKHAPCCVSPPRWKFKIIRKKAEPERNKAGSLQVQKTRLQRQPPLTGFSHNAVRADTGCCGITISENELLLLGGRTAAAATAAPVKDSKRLIAGATLHFLYLFARGEDGSRPPASHLPGVVKHSWLLGLLNALVRERVVCDMMRSSNYHYCCHFSRTRLTEITTGRSILIIMTLRQRCSRWVLGRRGCRREMCVRACLRFKLECTVAKQKFL